MIKRTSHAITHYFALIGLLVFALIGMIAFPYERNFQAAIALSVCIAYFVWGIVHHASHQNLHAIVILEYLSISLLGLVILLSIIFRS